MLFENLIIKKTNASEHKPMQLRGDISVVDMGLYKATSLIFVLNVSEFGDAVTAVLNCPARQSRNVEYLMALRCWDLT